MRGWRAAVVLTIYLFVLAGITLLFYGTMRGIGGGGTTGAQIGKFLFGTLVFFQMIMVSLLTPAFTAGSITSEREQKTYDLLMTTLLPARSVVFGKLGSALAYVALLILAVAPLESLSFMLGGVSPEEIILSQVTMMMSAVLFASVGIFWSSLLKSSVGSNVLTYGTILFQMIGVPLLYTLVGTIVGAFNPSYPGGPPALNSHEWFWYASGLILSLNPLVAMGISEAFLSTGDPLFIYTTTDLLNGHTLLVVSPWLLFCIESLVISTLLVLLSIRNVQPIHYKKQAPIAGPEQQELGYMPPPVMGQPAQNMETAQAPQPPTQTIPVSVQEPPRDR